MFSKVPGGGPPAFVTKMSSCPSSAVACSTNSRPELGVDRSASRVMTSPPIAVAASLSLAASRPQIATRTPSAARALAAPSPRPAEPAATAAVRPLMPRSIFKSLLIPGGKISPNPRVVLNEVSLGAKSLLARILFDACLTFLTPRLQSRQH